MEAITRGNKTACRYVRHLALASIPSMVQIAEHTAAGLALHGGGDTLNSQYPCVCKCESATCSFVGSRSYSLQFATCWRCPSRPSKSSRPPCARQSMIPSSDQPSGSLYPVASQPPAAYRLLSFLLPRPLTTCAERGCGIHQTPSAAVCHAQGSDDPNTLATEGVPPC